MKNLIISTFITLVLLNQAFAQNQNDGAYLDPKYNHQVKTKIDKTGKSFKFNKSNTLSVISTMTPVKSQGARGTCSIFSATALLEGLLVQFHNQSTQLDLSEEWLEYIIMRNKQEDGSSSPANFSAFFDHGVSDESLMPYIGEEWESLDFSYLARERCEHLEPVSSYKLKSCLLGHRDPALLYMTDDKLMSHDSEFLEARQDAYARRDEMILKGGYSYYFNKISDVRNSLLKGVPVTLDVDFYYGAWNHREAEKHGMTRNMDHWTKGVVGYPLEGSVDETESLNDPAGHSIVVVGYDDSVEVELEHLMPDGSIETKKYKGVYYFKNSWGTGSFGADFELDGEKHPGYGMILQKYAHKYGVFFKMPIKY